MFYLVLIPIVFLGIFFEGKTIVYTAPPAEAYIIKTEKPVPIENPIACSCIKTVREMGVNLPYNTNAGDLKSNSTIHIGVLVLFSYEKAEHVGMVVSIERDGFWIREGNFEKCKFTERFIDFDNPFLRGFHNPKSNENN